MLVIGAKIDYAFERFWDGGGQWTRTGTRRSSGIILSTSRAVI